MFSSCPGCLPMVLADPCDTMWSAAASAFTPHAWHTCSFSCSSQHTQPSRLILWSYRQVFSCHPASGFSFLSVLVLLSYAHCQSTILQTSKLLYSANAWLILDSSIASLSDLSQITVRNQSLFQEHSQPTPFALDLSKTHVCFHMLFVVSA